ncbi:MAG: diguanylate cyclase [Lachnospiraceae bacterium]
MGEKKKLTHSQRGVLIFAAIGLAAFFALNARNVYDNDISGQRERASNVTRAYAEELEQDLGEGITVTESLKELVVDGGGTTDFFALAGRMLAKGSVNRLGLAPNGVVTESYPRIMESIPDNLFENPDIASAAKAAQESGEPVLYGPVSFSGLGRGVLVLTPVFLDDDQRTLWGYTFALIRTPAVYARTLETMKSLGYEYCLDSTIMPGKTESERIEFSMDPEKTLENPVGYTFRLGQCSWTLNVEPSGGWQSRRALLSLFEGEGLWAVLVVMIWMLFRLGNQKRELREVAYRDALTGLYNRGGFMAQLDMVMKKSPAGPCTAVFLDLDDFKLINDVYGHAAGDAALCHLADHLAASFPKGALVGRTGGDEFCALLAGNASACRESVEAAVAGTQILSFGDDQIPYTVSAGYADLPAQAASREQLLVMADEALYAAKVSGKHEAKRYDSKMSGIKREQLGFSASSIAAGLPGPFVIFRAEEENQIVFANLDLIRLFGCGDYYDLLQYADSGFLHLVHPDDRTRVQEDMHSMIRQRQESAKEDGASDRCIEFRIVTRDGAVIPVTDVGRLVQDAHYGTVIFNFLYRMDRKGEKKEKTSLPEKN